MSARKKGKVVSLSGDPVAHYRDGPKSFAPPPENLGTERIARHIERYLGPVEAVFHEFVSDAVHIDVHWVKPTPARPLHFLVTSGMSDRAMNVPAKVEAPHRIELVVTLPERWAIGDEAFANENWYWPVRQLKTLARFPHKYDSWLGEGHTVTNGDPPQPLAPSTRLCGAILLAPRSVPKAFTVLRVDAATTIHFLAVIPVYDEEMMLKTRAGAAALSERLRAHGTGDIVEPTRPNVARGAL
jgi:hypothetical protein